MANLVPDFSGIQANTSGALRNLLDANRAVTESYMAPVDRLERYAKEAEAKRILDEDRAFKLEDRALRLEDRNIAMKDKELAKQKEANTAELLFANRDKDAFIASKIAGEKQAAYDSLNNLTGQEAIDTKNQLDAYFAGQGARDSGNQWIRNAQAATNIDAIKVEQALFDQKKLQEDVRQKELDRKAQAANTAAQVAATNRNSNLQEMIYNDKVAELKEIKDAENMANKIALGLNPETKYEVKQQRAQTEQEKLNSASSYGNKLLEDKDVQKSLSNIDKNNIGINKIDEALSKTTYSKMSEAKNKLKDLEPLKLTDEKAYYSKVKELSQSLGGFRGVGAPEIIEDKILNYSPNSEEKKLIDNRKLLQQNIDKEALNVTKKADNNFNVATASKVDEIVTKTKNLSDDEITRMAKNIALGKDINYSGEYSSEDQEKLNKNSGSILKAVTPAIKAVKDQEDKDRDARAKIAEENRKNEQKIKEIILENQGAIKVAEVRAKNGNKMNFQEFAKLPENKDLTGNSLVSKYQAFVDQGFAIPTSEY